jgi:hypothetical protein
MKIVFASCIGIYKALVTPVNGCKRPSRIEPFEIGWADPEATAIGPPANWRKNGDSVDSVCATLLRQAESCMSP